jgi:hypothetical protein
MVNKTNKSGVKLDVIITTAYSPYLNSIVNLKKTIESIKNITDLRTNEVRYRLIIALDGLNPNYNSIWHQISYRRFVRKVTKFEKKGVIIAVNKNWGHLSGNLNNAFEFAVRSRFTLVVQDDLMFICDLPIQEIITTIETDAKIKHVRFNRRSNIVSGRDTKLTQIKSGSLFFLKTNNWSDNNHITSSDYYRKIVFPLIGNKKTYPEDVLRKFNETDSEVCGTYIYGKLNSHQTIQNIGDFKSRIRAQMLKLDTTSIGLAKIIFYLILIHDLLKPVKHLIIPKRNSRGT